MLLFLSTILPVWIMCISMVTYIYFPSRFTPGWLPWSLTGETDSQVVETQKLGFLRREGGGGGRLCAFSKTQGTCDY